jgi:hypothetical protein
LKPIIDRPVREKTSITPPGRMFGKRKLSGLIKTSVFSTFAPDG